MSTATTALRPARTYEINLQGYCTQAEARTVVCPYCKAEAGEPCVGVRGRRKPRKQCHVIRHGVRFGEARTRPLRFPLGTAREEALKVACPDCGAEEGQPCRNKRKGTQITKIDHGRYAARLKASGQAYLGEPRYGRQPPPPWNYPATSPEKTPTGSVGGPK